MPSTIVKDLRNKTDAAWANLSKQLQGMEPYMDRSDAPGEWTTREVLSHLLIEPGLNPGDAVKKFSVGDVPLIEITVGQTNMTDERRTMTIRQFIDAIDTQRRSAFGYLEGLPEADLHRRKARIPLFKQFMGTDEISIAVYVGAMFDLHWNDHAGQLAKIRRAAGLLEAR